MKRKIIQIAGSTQLVSLPRPWAKRNNIQRGQEVEVQEDGAKVIVYAGSDNILEKAEIDISDLGEMTTRCIHALYKKGVDEIRVTFKDPAIVRVVQNAIGKEAVGYEILEQGDNYCTIKYVHGSIEEFDAVLRRTFLVLLNMASQCQDAIKLGKFESLKSVAFLEEANNRFTHVCRRYLNKAGSGFEGKNGPMYTIIEELERVADQYKYLCNTLYEIKGKSTSIDKNAFKLFVLTNDMLRIFYELFYKFEVEKLVKLKEQRNFIFAEIDKAFRRKPTYQDSWVLHHTLALSNRIFGMTGPLMILRI